MQKPFGLCLGGQWGITVCNTPTPPAMNQNLSIWIKLQNHRDLPVKGLRLDSQQQWHD
jgi:hypothetical protein